MGHASVSGSFSLIILGFYFVKSRIVLFNPEAELKILTLTCTPEIWDVIFTGICVPVHSLNYVNEGKV